MGFLSNRKVQEGNHALRLPMSRYWIASTMRWLNQKAKRFKNNVKHKNRKVKYKHYFKWKDVVPEGDEANGLSYNRTRYDFKEEGRR